MAKKHIWDARAVTLFMAKLDNSGALLFTFRPLSGKQKKKLCVLPGSAVKEGGDVKWRALACDHLGLLGEGLGLKIHAHAKGFETLHAG